MMESIVFKEVGAKVAQFMGYNNLKPEQVHMLSGILLERNIFGIRFGKSLDKVLSIFCVLEGFVTLSLSPHVTQ